MKELQIKITPEMNPEALWQCFKDKNLKKGDTLKLIVNGKEPLLLIMGFQTLLVVLFEKYFKQNSELQSIQNQAGFINKYKSPDEFNQDIFREFNINVELNYENEPESEEKEGWLRAGIEHWNMQYDDQEEDISHLQVKEPNPKFNG